MFDEQDPLSGSSWKSWMFRDHVAALVGRMANPNGSMVFVLHLRCHTTSRESVVRVRNTRGDHWDRDFMGLYFICMGERYDYFGAVRVIDTPATNPRS